MTDTTPARTPIAALSLAATNLTEQQLAGIRTLLGADVKPAVDDLLVQLAEASRDYRAYRTGDMPGTNVLYGLNMSSYMGERMPFVLSRLINAEMETARLRARIAELEAAPARDAEPDLWQRLTDALNAVAAAHDGMTVELDGHITTLTGERHIIWQPSTQTWHLAD